MEQNTLLPPSKPLFPLPESVMCDRPPVTVPMVHVINLAHRQDRWERFRRHLREELGWNVPILRHDAINTRAWTVQPHTEMSQTFHPWVHPTQLELITQQSRYDHPELTRGAVGCAFSHMALWGILQAHDTWEHMLIFEDDAVWCAPERLSLEQTLEQINAIPRDWDVMLLGGRMWEVQAWHETHIQLNTFTCLQAYIVSRSAVPKLMRGILPMREQIDYALSRKCRDHSLRVYAPSRLLFWQTGGGDTDIQIPLAVDCGREY